MKFGMDQIDEVTSKIRLEKLPHKNCVVIGDNSSGKSLLLKNFITKIGKSDTIYFIDAVNRGFDVKKVPMTNKGVKYNSSILQTRLEDNFFNLKDSFNCFGTLTECIEMIYPIYEIEVQNLFFKLTGDRFNVIYGDPLGEVEFENGRGLLSSGYQALIRILLELLFYQDTGKFKEEAWVVIDEIDEFLSPKYAALILEFLKQEFLWAKWVVTTHSCDLVAHTTNANLIVLDNEYEENEIERTLRKLLNNRINNAWGKKDETCLIKLKGENLSASQKLILNQIQEW